MIQNIPLKTPKEFVIAHQETFKEWRSLNDTIMGGASNATCSFIDSALVLEGELVEEGGGFVSCRSPIYERPLNLSKYKGLQVEVEGGGRTLKLAVASKNWILGLSEFVNSSITWIVVFPTNDNGITRINIPFTSFKPTVRARSVPIPFPLDYSQITRFQLLHSKFGEPDQLNPGFRPGHIKIVLHSISGYL